jgi:hypothetical protein
MENASYTQYISFHVQKFPFQLQVDKNIGWDGIDWIDLAQDRDQWRTLVNTVINLRVP